MKRPSFLALLSGTDRRSIGKSDEVVKSVLERPRSFAELIGGLLCDNPVVRMRAADAIEKITRIRPDLLRPYVQTILGEAAAIDQKEVRWHVALLFSRLPLTMTETKAAYDTLQLFLLDSSSIVRTFAMQSLAEIALRHAEFRASITDQIETLARSGTPAMKSRGKKLLKLLAKRDFPLPVPRLTFRELGPETWNDFESLFGERGACGGCWCMAWRQTRAQYDARKGALNKRSMRRLVGNRAQLGILAYDGGRPIGWCAVAPREEFSRLGSSRVLRPVDEKAVWSIPCFFVAKDYRRRGLSAELLKGVIAICRKKGVRILEAYPIIPYAADMPAAFAWTGTLSAFLKAGFRQERRWSKSRPIVRYYLR